MIVTTVAAANQFAHIGELIITRAESIISVVHMIVHQTLHLMQCSYFLTLGALETVMGLFRGKVTVSENSEKFRSALKDFYERIKSIPGRIVSYDFIHGGLMLGTGVCELLLGLQQLDVLALGAAGAVVGAVSNGCFFLGNIVMLIHNVNLFHKASLIGKDASEEVKRNAKRVKLSAIISMISAINYIVGMATVMLGGPVALIIFFICLGLTFGGLKILYDWFQPYKENLLQGPAYVQV